MNKRQHTYRRWLNELQNEGWDVQKQDAVRFNSGSETARHQHAKLATCRVLKNNEYRVDTEVPKENVGIADVAALPTQDDQRPFLVELEHSPTTDTVESKLERYWRDEPWVECWVINLNRAPLDCLELEQHIADELGLTV